MLATLPNFLIMEHLEDDCPQRYEVIDHVPESVSGEIVVGRDPGKDQAREDVTVAVRDAFDAARRQLLAFSERKSSPASKRRGLEP